MKVALQINIYLRYATKTTQVDNDENKPISALLLVQHRSYFPLMAIGRFRRSLRTGSYGWV